jgi:hypothetical protein
MRAVDNRQFRKILDEIGADYKMKSDDKAAEMTITLPRSALKKPFENFVSWLPWPRGNAVATTAGATRDRTASPQPAR